MNAPALRVVGAELTLDELASVANAEHRLAVRSAEQVLEHARRAGEALLKAKAALPHGAFMPWVREHCSSISHRTATTYMVIARRWNDFKVERPSNLAAALAEVALERVVKPSATDLDVDALRVNPRQAWLFGEDELPLSPRDPSHQREVMVREDGHAYRCPCCATEWSGEPRPPLRGKLGVPRVWKLPKRASPLDP